MLKLVCILLVAGLLLGCTASHTKPVIGVLVPATGDFAAFGEEIVAGIEAANDGSVKIIVEDTQCINRQTVSSYNKLSQVDNVQFFIGPACGSPQEVVASAIAEIDQLTVLPSAAAENLYDQSGEKLFQMQYSLDVETAFMTDVIEQDNHTSAVLVSYQNAFSQTHANSFKKNFDGEILADIVIPDVGSDINIVATKVKELEPDAMYVADLSYFIDNGLQKLEEANIEVPIYSMYVVEIPFVRELVEGVVYSYPGDIDSEKGAVYSLANQAASILIDAINTCNAEYNCVRESLQQSEHFDENGVSTRTIDLYKIENGQTVRI